MSRSDVTDRDVRRLAATVWGAANDAALWDGWRTHGAQWAWRYLLAAIHRGVDRIGTERPEVRAPGARRTAAHGSQRDHVSRPLSPELRAGIAAYDARISALGGYGATVTAPAPDGVWHTGILGEAGSGGCQPMITDADGRRWRIDERRARRARQS